MVAAWITMLVVDTVRSGHYAHVLCDPTKEIHCPQHCPGLSDLTGQECQKNILVFAGLGGAGRLEAGRGRSIEESSRRMRVTEAGRRETPQR